MDNTQKKYMFDLFVCFHFFVKIVKDFFLLWKKKKNLVEILLYRYLKMNCWISDYPHKLLDLHFFPFSSYCHLIKRKNIASFKFDLSSLIEKLKKYQICFCVLLVFLLRNEILFYLLTFKRFDLKKYWLLVFSKKACLV